jgi:putative ABC transport system substrate-binding protein
MKRHVLIMSLAVLMGIGIPVVQAEQTIKIGVIHLLERPDFTLLRESFLDELQKKGYTVEVTVFNADSVTYPDTYPQRAAEEAQRMEAAGIQLIYCIATYHGVVQADLKIPVIDGMMFSPDLLKLAIRKEDGKMYCTGNATGVLFGYSFKDILAFARDSLPNAKKMAYLYNPRSPVSRPLAEIEVAAQKVGFEIVGEQFTNKDEVVSAIKQAVELSEVAFITNDMGALGAEKPVVEFADAHNYPLIVGIMRLVGENGVVAGIQYNWERAGRICAGKADQILKGTPANTIPLEFSDQFEIQLNLKTAQKLGIEIPYTWIEMATNVIE